MIESSSLTNASIAERFELMADLLELEGAVAYRVLAYRRAAKTLRATTALHLSRSWRRSSALDEAVFLTFIPYVGQRGPLAELERADICDDRPTVVGRKIVVIRHSAHAVGNHLEEIAHRRVVQLERNSLAFQAPCFVQMK